jgi:hypothetical protein
MAEGTEFDSWFDEDELERCPDCGNRRLIPGEPQQPLRVCLDCGIVDARDADAADFAAHRDCPEQPRPDE